MMEQTMQTIHEMEATVDCIYHRVQPLIHSDTKMSVEELHLLTDIVKDCASVYKTIYKITNGSMNVDNSRKI